MCEGSGAAALRVLERVGATTEQLPVVVTFDGLVPRDPSFAEVAEALSAPTRPAAAADQAIGFGADIVHGQRAVGLHAAGPDRVVTMGDGTALGEDMGQVGLHRAARDVSGSLAGIFCIYYDLHIF